MKSVQRITAFLALLLAIPAIAQTTDRGFLYQDPTAPPAPAKLHDPTIAESCRGAVTLVQDVGFEGVKTTPHNFNNATGGGESFRFDPTPVLSAKVDLKGGCLNAHLSALVGSAQTYGTSPITMFQVTLTGLTVPVATRHMYGHYETPYGIYGPAVAIEAERDVDQFAANFFQRIGSGPTDVPPGIYQVDVWWAGGPAGAGGAIGAAFVLKLYQQ